MLEKNCTVKHDSVHWDIFHWYHCSQTEEAVFILLTSNCFGTCILWYFIALKLRSSSLLFLQILSKYIFPQLTKLFFFFWISDMVYVYLSYPRENMLWFLLPSRQYAIWGNGSASVIWSNISSQGHCLLILYLRCEWTKMMKLNSFILW